MQSLGFTFSQINSDILHQIAESCGDSRTHINCSLVCRTWQDVFSRSVFRSIRISSTARLEWLMNLLDQKPHMSSWIKVLTCRGCPQESPRNGSLIPFTIQLLSEKLVAVHTWKILHCSWSYKYHTNQGTIAKWSSVTTLSTTDCYFDADAFHILISTLPRLGYFQSFDGTSFIKKITTADTPTITAGTPFAPQLTSICMDVFTVKRMMDAIDVARWSNLSELYVISPLHYPLPQLHRLLSILGSKLRKFGFLEPKDPIKLANAVADVTAMRHCVALQSFTWRTITDENLIKLLKELPNPFKLRQLIFAFPTLFLGTITPGYITVLDKFLTEEFTGLRLIEIRYEGLLSYSEAEKRVHRYFTKSTARGIMKVTKMLTKWTSSEDYEFILLSDSSVVGGPTMPRSILQ